MSLNRWVISGAQQHSAAGLTALALGVAMSWAGSTQAATVYNEGFSGAGSTMDGASQTPTATSTSWHSASSKNNAGFVSVDTDSVNLNADQTSSGFQEGQALFAASPVSLSTAGDYVQLQFTFSSVGLVTTGSGSGTLNIGLFNSGGSAPLANGALSNSGLSSATTYPDGSGGVEDWAGYIGRIGLPALSSGLDVDIYDRSAQNDTTNENQDLLLSNAGTGAYDSPSGTTVASNADDGVILTNNQLYTYVMRLTLQGDNSLVIDIDLYEGAGTGGTQLIDATGTTSTTPVATAFDGLGIGYRATGSLGPYGLELSALTVETNTVVPEPASMALMGLGGLLMVQRRRARR